MPDTHSQLLERLVRDARPVRRLWLPRTRLAAWLVLQALVVAAATHLGLRPDLLERMGDRTFVLELVAIGFAAGSFTLLALRAAVPGAESRRFHMAIVVVSLAAAAGVMLRQPVHAEVQLGDFIQAGLRCALRTLAFAALPWAALAVALRRGAPLAATTAGAFAGAGALLMAFGVMRAACPMDELLHVTVWHGLPVLAGLVVSAVVGLLWFPRWRAERGRR